MLFLLLRSRLRSGRGSFVLKPKFFDPLHPEPDEVPVFRICFLAAYFLKSGFKIPEAVYGSFALTIAPGDVLAATREKYSLLDLVQWDAMVEPVACKSFIGY